MPRLDNPLEGLTMSRLLRQKKITVTGAVCLVMAAAGAYAYWTAGGDGTGSAATGTTEALSVNQTTVLAPMYPGLAAQTISGTFDNSNDGPIYVGTVTASIGSVTQADGAVGGCDATDYTLANAAMTVGAQVPAGSAVGAWTGATLMFNNKPAVNQDGCKGATVNLVYTIS